MIRLALSSCFAFILLTSHAQDSTIQFLALGDSYTIGESVDENDRWPNLLAGALNNSEIQVSVEIIAKTGWRTDQLLDSIRNHDFNLQYDVVTLLIGVNNQYQGKPLQQYKREFAELLTTAKSLTKKENSVLFVVSIPDYYFTPFGQDNRTNQVSIEIDQYNSHAESICASRKIPFVNITDISRLGLESPELVAKDGLHPSATQYSQWVKRLVKEVDMIASP